MIEGVGGAGGEHRPDRDSSEGDPGDRATGGQEARRGGEDDESAVEESSGRRVVEGRRRSKVKGERCEIELEEGECRKAGVYSSR